MGSLITDSSTATGSSIFSSEASFPYTDTTWVSDTPLKRKNGREPHLFRIGQKRRRLIGRPKNEWSPTRTRKLVRLYQMTELDLIEIVKVLQSRDFKPCKRDVQKQLNNLLQPQPDKIRLKGNISNRRLCQLPPASTIHTEPESELYLPEFGLQEVLGEPSPSLARRSSLEISGFSVQPEVAANCSDLQVVNQVDSLLYQDVAAIKLDRDHGRLGVNPPRVNTTFVRDEIDVESLSSLGGSSTRSSIIGLKSLRRRLSSRYTLSKIEDILYILERLTLSGSSAISSSRDGRRSRVFSMTSSRSRLDLGANPEFEEPTITAPSILPLPPLNLLAGAFPGYCWEQINQNALSRCENVADSRTSICQPTSLRMAASIRANIFSRILANTIRMKDINEIDSFGNSVLHIATGLSANPSYLISLIGLGAQVNTLNSAGQTFLHLLPRKCLEDNNDFCLLLGAAKAVGFDFDQKDHLGQTVLHLLTRPWIPKSVLSKVIKSLYGIGITPKASRDYICTTVVEQLNTTGMQASGFDSDLEIAILGLTSEIEGHITAQKSSMNQEEQKGLFRNDHRHFLNYEKPSLIESMADLQQYEYHADLLRTISKAGYLPWCEDSSGRNGLHCLAEVSFKLPLPGISWDGIQPDNDYEPREANLDNLLEVGVDPNNYDKQGNTPLMAFITHHRPSEGEDLTTRILSKLLDAGANIYRRNREGETALHVAVKLGRRAATKLLLKRKANFHARTSKGLGVVALGHECCKRAIKDDAVYAQILLCISLVIDSGAVSTPTVLQEWNVSSSS